MTDTMFSSELWRALFLSLQLSAVTTALLLLVAVPLAFWLNNSRAFYRGFIEIVVTLPIVLPPTVIGFYLLVLMAPHHGFGQFWQTLFGAPLAFSFAGLVCGSVLYSLPFAVQPIQAAFRGVNTELIEASAALGATRWQIFYTVILPVARYGVFAGAVLCFAHTMGEFGVVLMLGGNIPDETRVASIALYDEVQQLNYATAHRYALLLVLVALVLMSVGAWLQKRVPHQAPRVRI